MEISQRLVNEASPERAATLWAATKVLMGLRYPKEQVEEFSKGVSAMILGIRGIEESSVYQDIFSKGEAKGEPRVGRVRPRAELKDESRGESRGESKARSRKHGRLCCGKDARSLGQRATVSKRRLPRSTTSITSTICLSVFWMSRPGMSCSLRPDPLRVAGGFAQARYDCETEPVPVLASARNPDLWRDASTARHFIRRRSQNRRPHRSEDQSRRMTTRPDHHGRLAVYVTSHGFGHLNRTAAVLNHVPADVPVTIRSHSNLFEHWRERLKRPAELEHYVCDVGAVNPPGDSNATDPVATLELAMRFHAEAMATVDDQVRRLREQQTAAVLCDAPAVPLVAARRAGVPGFLMSNFTWADIYAPYARARGRRGPAVRRRPARVLPPGHGDVSDRAGHEHVVAVAGDRAGHGREPGPRPQRRAAPAFRLEQERQAGLPLYRPVWPERPRLVAVGAIRGAGNPFPGLSARAATGPDNLHVVPSADWPGGDLIASSDAIVAKAGYGTVCEAMASGTPMIYPPRTGFAEFRSLDRALRAWGGGVPVSSRDFFTLRLDQSAWPAHWQSRPGAARSRPTGPNRSPAIWRTCASRHAVARVRSSPVDEVIAMSP